MKLTQITNYIHTWLFSITISPQYGHINRWSVTVLDTRNLSLSGSNTSANNVCVIETERERDRGVKSEIIQYHIYNMRIWTVTNILFLAYYPGFIYLSFSFCYFFFFGRTDTVHLLLFFCNKFWTRTIFKQTSRTCVFLLFLENK